MATDIGIQLPEHSDHFIKRQLDTGRFASPSEVIEAALLLLEERETKRAQWLAVFEQAERESMPPPKPSSDETRTLG